MGELHVNNHFVPECYLKRWQNSNKKILVYRTLVEHSDVPVWRPHSVSAIAYQKHLYTQLISGNESDEIETWLDKEFESPANEVIEKAISDSRLTSEDWQILIKFLAAQDVRTPARLLEHLKRNKKNLPEVLQGTLNKLKKNIENEKLDDLRTQSEKCTSEPFPLKVTEHFDDGSDTVIVKAETYIGRSTWIYSIKHLLNNTWKILLSHKWSLVKPAKGFYWPTSDNPVIKLNYYQPGKYDLKGGWGVKKGNIFFPIGPEHAMFVQIGDRPVQRGSRLSQNLTKELIKYLTANAHRKIFSHEENHDIPILRKREIDPERLSREKAEIRLWHQKNIKMEREYLTTNRMK